MEDTKRCESVSISAERWCCLISTLVVNVDDVENVYHASKYTSV